METELKALTARFRITLSVRHREENSPILEECGKHAEQLMDFAKSIGAEGAVDVTISIADDDELRKEPHAELRELMKTW